MKTFDLAEYAKKLAFGRPLVEPTASCHKCWQPTAIKELDTGCFCKQCAGKVVKK